MDSLLEAFRTGRGVPYAEYGETAVDGVGSVNRPSFLQLLGSEWIPALPELHVRLQSDPPARVADIGCGVGWSAIGLARSDPRIHVDGFDVDPASIERAREHVRGERLYDRVNIQDMDAAHVRSNEPYDLVMVIECIHDMSRPVEAQRAMKRFAGPNGTVLVVNERVEEEFTARGNDVEWMMYGFSVLVCLPVGMAEQPSAGTGTVMRPRTLRRYAREAGFHSVEILSIENEFWRFYRLHQN